MWSTLDAARCDTIPICKLMPRSIYDELYWHYIQMTCNGRVFASSVDRLLTQRDAARQLSGLVKTRSDSICSITNHSYKKIPKTAALQDGNID